MDDLKKRAKAAALKYDRASERAPRMVAKGSGLIAKKIIDTAQEHGIAIREDPDLVEVLATLDLYQEIPESLFRVVASILAELYKINKNYQK